MGKSKIIIPLILALAVLGGYFYLYKEKTKFELKVVEQEVQITEYKGKIVDQETEINLLKADIETKQQAITALEEKNRKSALASQQTIDDLLELYNISVPNVDLIHPRKEETNPAAEKEEKKEPGVIDDETSQKLINLRNNIYNRYK